MLLYTTYQHLPPQARSQDMPSSPAINKNSSLDFIKLISYRIQNKIQREFSI